MELIDIIIALTVFGTLAVLALIAVVIVHGGNRHPYPTKEDKQ